MDKEDTTIPRVRFGDERLSDEEDGYVTHERRQLRGLSRQSSVGSLSIRSAGGGARTVQPEAALPITYRTLSIEIDEGKEKRRGEVKKVKEKAAVGRSLPSWKLIRTALLRMVVAQSMYSRMDETPQQMLDPY